MSRGARGGGRGRGGGASRGKHRIGGQEMSWDYDPELDTPSEPQKLFPDMGEEFPTTQPPTLRERRAVCYFKAIRNRIHKGPLHTVLSDNARISKDRGSQTAKQYDPFNDMPRYSQKYKAPQHDLPQFNTRAYPIKFFPEELADVLDPTRARVVPRKRPNQRRNRPIKMEDEDDEAVEGEEQPNEGEEQRKPDEDEEPEEAEPDPDENFEEDEDEMAGDYNAEGYFSGGEREDDDLAMGADDGGGDLE